MDPNDSVSTLYELAVAAQRAGDYRGLKQIAAKLVGLCEPVGDAKGLGVAHFCLGLSYFLQSDGRRAREEYEAALAFAESADDRAGILRIRLGLAAVAGDIDLDVDTLRRWSEAALFMAREIGDEKNEGIALGNLAEACHLQGDYEHAIRFACEAADIFQHLERWSSAGAQYATVGNVYALRGDFSQSIEYMGKAWEYLRREPVPLHRAWYFQVWFLIAAALDRWEIAAQLYGFVAHYRDVHNTPRLQGMLPWLSGPIEQQYKELGYDRAAELARRGEAYSIAQVHELVATLQN